MSRVENSIIKFDNYFNKENNGEYKIIVPYKNTREKVDIEHDCGNIISRTPSNIYKYGFICRKCYRDTSRRKTPDDYVIQFNEVMGSDYMLVSEYTINKEPVEIMHYICGKIYKARADIPITMGVKCPYCNSNVPWVKDGFYKLLDEYNGEYTLVSDYIASKKPVIMIHNDCKSEIKVTPYDFTIRGGYCIACGMSSGEEMVTRVLDSIGADYKYQYPKIINPKNGIKGLTFDFSIMNGRNVIGIIEYDGKQHSSPSSIFYDSLEDFENSVYRDSVKNDYCFYNNIPLLRLDNSNWKETNKLTSSFIQEITQPQARPNAEGRKLEIDSRVKHL